MSNNEIKTKIIKAAARRFSHFGFKKTTVNELSSDAGISAGAVYLHFKGKEEILYEVLMGQMESHIAAWEKILAGGAQARDQIPEMALYFVAATVEAGKTFFGKTFLEEELTRDMREKYRFVVTPMLAEVMIKAVEKGKTDGSIKPDLDSAKLTLTVLEQMRFTIFMAIQDPEFYWKERWHDWWDFICRGICP